MKPADQYVKSSQARLRRKHPAKAAAAEKPLQEMPRVIFRAGHVVQKQRYRDREDAVAECLKAAGIR